MGFLLPIIKLIVWTVGGFVLFGVCAFIKESLQPKLGGFAFLIAVIMINCKSVNCKKNIIMLFNFFKKN